jgi:branched-chain amino acid transport system permease protein
MMTLLGGAGTIYGPMIGAAVVLLIRNTLSTITDSGSLILGCLFVVIVMVFRRGILGELVHHIVHRERPDDGLADGKAVGGKGGAGVPTR